MTVDAHYGAGTKLRVTDGFPPDFFGGLSEPALVVEVGDHVNRVAGEESRTWPAHALIVSERGERG